LLTHLRPARRAGGFTLVELLVVSAAMIFVMALTLSSFTAHRNTYAVIDNVSQVHQNSLAIDSLMERDIRQAGFLVPTRAAACGLDSTNSTDLLVVSDANAIQTVDLLSNSSIGKRLSVDVSSFPSGTSGTVMLSSLVLDGVPTYHADPGVPGANSDFQSGGGVIFESDTANPPVRCGSVGTVNATANTVQVTLLDGAGNFPAIGSGWKAVPGHLYRVVGAQLQRDGVALADDVEDLQIAWFYDGNQNGQVDAGEYLGTSAATQLQLNALPNNDSSLLREIRFNLVLRTADKDPTKPTNAGTGQATENQTAVPGADGRRRRVLTATTRLRNLSS
jgi:type II secretory pathway pseudopilin PulG